MSPRRPDMPSLDRADLMGDPIAQFSAWWGDAEEVPLREAMTLATVDAEGRPDARMVLLKGFGTVGFRFFTNYESAKAGAARRGGARRARRLLARARPAGPGARADRDSWTPRRRTSTSPRALATPSSAPGRRRRAGRSPTGPSSTRGSPRPRSASTVWRWPGRSIGAAMSCTTRSSSSGRARWAASTTASSTGGPATDGQPSAWGLER